MFSLFLLYFLVAMLAVSGLALLFTKFFFCTSLTFLLLLRAGLTLAFGCYCLTPMSSLH